MLKRLRHNPKIRSDQEYLTQIEEQHRLNPLSLRKNEKWALKKSDEELISLKKPKAEIDLNQKFSYSEIERKYNLLLKQMNQELENKYSAQVKGVNSVSRPQNRGLTWNEF